MSACPARRRGVERRAGSPRHGLGRATALAAVLAAGAASPLRAQTNLETNSAIQFNFAAPGAANLALGGAFIGLAFDGTAAYTNPAGLTNILRPEVWIEGRSWSYTHVYTDRGRLEGEPRDVGVDTEQGLREGRAQNHMAGPSFVSYVHPGRRWSFALYAHKLLDFEASFSTQGAFLAETRGRSPLGIPGDDRDGRLAALVNTMDAEIDSYGLAAGYRLGRDVSLGVAVSNSALALDSRADRFLPQLLEPPSPEDELVNFQTQRGSDSDWSHAFGVLWQSPERTWSAGAVYRSGPDFRFRATSQTELDRTDPQFFDPKDQPAVFHVPDVYGVGFAWRPSDRFLVALDCDRVEYSDLLDDFVDIFALTDLFPDRDPELEHFRIDDVSEIHLGAELWFPRGDRAISLRFGSWYDPDHALRFDGVNRSYRAIFRGGSDELHWTGGIGLALRTLQVDVAFDYSERVSIGSLSAGTRF